MFSRLYNRFPRQIGLPKRVTVQNKEEFLNYVNKYNGKTRIFGSVYNYTPEAEHLVILDKVFFDFDGDMAYDNVCRLGRHLVENDVVFNVHCSGFGYHCYVYLDTSRPVINKRDCLTNIQNHFIKELNLEVDSAVIGDLARLATVPGTFNTRRQRYCIALTYEELQLGHKAILELAKTQRMGIRVIGKKLFDPKPFDKPSESNHYEYGRLYEFSNGQSIDDADTCSMHPCINNILSNGNSVHIGYRGRFHLITYMRDTGVLPVTAQTIIKKYLTNVHDGKPEWQHCFNKQQIQKLYRNDRYPFARCEILVAEGICPCNGNCGRTIDYGGYHKADIYL